MRNGKTEMQKGKTKCFPSLPTPIVGLSIFHQTDGKISKAKQIFISLVKTLLFRECLEA